MLKSQGASAPAIIAEGGFNTGRQYTADGQQIYWWLMSTNKVVFFDRSRMIIGETLDAAEPEGIAVEMRGPQEGSARRFVARWIMDQYDGHRYDMAVSPARVPADFDFGLGMRI